MSELGELGEFITGRRLDPAKPQKVRLLQPDSHKRVSGIPGAAQVEA